MAIVAGNVWAIARPCGLPPELVPMRSLMRPCRKPSHADNTQEDAPAAAGNAQTPEKHAHGEWRLNSGFKIHSLGGKGPCGIDTTGLMSSSRVWNFSFPAQFTRQKRSANLRNCHQILSENRPYPTTNQVQSQWIRTSTLLDSAIDHTAMTI